MELTSEKVFNFMKVEGQETETKSLDGDFFIMNGDECIGEVSVSTMYGSRNVSAETPDTNLSIVEWMTFLIQLKERFQLEDTQEVMMNKHPASFAKYA